MQLSGYITLTTDWGQHDFYTGILKGRILSECPNYTIIDLAHSVPSFNIPHASFVIRHSYRNFPEGTIHLCMVNSDSETNPRFLYTQMANQHFLVPDNGMINLLFGEPPTQVIEVPFEANSGFASLDCIVGLLSSMNSGVDLNEYGAITTSYNEKIALRATIDDSIVNGNIIYVDSFQNVISNISRKLFERIGNGRKFDLYVQSNFNHITTISKSYAEVPPGELVALFNSVDLLEIAIRDGFAAQLLNLNVGSGVRVKFS